MAETDATEEKRSEIIKAEKERLKGIESLADTPWSKLFHEARTANQQYTGVSVQVRVRNGEIETSEPIKTRQGEHLRGTDSYDGIISLPTQSFMDVQTARQELNWRLRDLAQYYQQKERQQQEGI